MIFESLGKSAVIARFYVVYLQSDRAIKNYQRAALRRLLTHFGQATPMWKTLLERNGLNLDSSDLIGELGRMPIICKRTFRDIPPEEYVANTLAHLPRWRRITETDGSVFEYLPNYLRTGGFAFYERFIRLRFLAWRRRLHKPLGVVRVVRIGTVDARTEHQLDMQLHGFQKHPAGFMERIAEFRPDVLEGRGEDIAEIARAALGMPPPGLRVLFAVCDGAELTPDVRELLERAYGCETYERFGPEEIGTISMECELHEGQHIYSESVVVEIVDDRGARVPDGMCGRVVVTDLINYIMPFIRYDTGNRGRMTTEPCACGLDTPRLWIHGGARPLRRSS